MLITSVCTEWDKPDLGFTKSGILVHKDDRPSFVGVTNNGIPVLEKLCEPNTLETVIPTDRNKSQLLSCSYDERYIDHHYRTNPKKYRKKHQKDQKNQKKPQNRFRYTNDRSNRESEYLHGIYAEEFDYDESQLPWPDSDSDLDYYSDCYSDSYESDDSDMYGDPLGYYAVLSRRLKPNYRE